MCVCFHVWVHVCVFISISVFNKSLLFVVVVPSRLSESSWCTSSSGEWVNIKWGTVWGSTLAERAPAGHLTFQTASIAVVILNIPPKSIPYHVAFSAEEKSFCATSCHLLCTRCMSCCWFGAGIWMWGFDWLFWLVFTCWWCWNIVNVAYRNKYMVSFLLGSPVHLHIFLDDRIMLTDDSELKQEVKCCLFTWHTIQCSY